MKPFRCTYRDADHSYWFSLKGRRFQVPSVTQCCGEYFAETPANIVASDKGHAIHDCIRLALDGSDYPIEYSPWVAAFKRWAAAVDFEPLWSEKVVYSRSLCYAGRLDLLGYVNRQLAIVDMKTGVVPKSVGMQLAGYEHAASEMLDKKIGLGFSLQLTARGHVGYVFRPAILDFYGFLKRLNALQEQPEWKERASA